MGAGIHSFLMFAPFFAFPEKPVMMLQGAILFFTGPIMAAYITSNLYEQASIWCFFSIAQVRVHADTFFFLSWFGSAPVRVTSRAVEADLSLINW
jgi:hypothetical protein